MDVNRILAIVVAILLAVVGIALAAYGYVKHDAVAERLGLQPCCAEQTEPCCPEAAVDIECCPQGTEQAIADKEAGDGI